MLGSQAGALAREPAQALGVHAFGAGRIESDRAENGALLEQAGLRWSPSKLMQMALFGGFAGFVTAWYMMPPPFDKFAWLAAAAGFCAPLVYVIRKGRARKRA